MNRVIFLCFAIVMTLSGHAQKSNDSFDELADKIRESTYYDSSRVFFYGAKAIRIARKKNDLSKEGLIYRYYGDFHFYSGKPQIALKYYDTTLMLAKQVGDTTLMNSAYIRENFIQSGKDPLVAEKEFKRLLNVSERRGDMKNALQCLNGLGIIHQEKYDYGKALNYYIQAYKYARKLKDPYLEGMLLNNIGLIKYRNEQYDEALSDFKKGIRLADSIQNTRLAFNLENNLGLLYEKTGEYKKSVTHYENSLVNAKQIGFPMNIAITHLNLGNSYLLNKDFIQAMSHADSTIQIFEKINNLKHIAKPYLVYAEVYKEMERIDLALETVNNALALAVEQDNSEDIATSYGLKSEILKAKEDYKAALEAHELFHRFNDSIEELSNKEAFAEIQVIYETEKKEAELKQAHARTAILETDNKLKESRIIIITVISIFILLSTLVFFYLRQMRNSQIQQKKFSRELIENLDEERLRISRDLHDDIGQSLSVVKSKINLFEKGQLSGLDGLEENLGDIIQQTRTLSHRLHPSYLEKIGLKRSIISLLNEVEKNTGIITSYDIISVVDDIPLMKQSQIYRIIQECINNTIKHAEAKSIKVSFTRENEEFMMQYRDSGKGIDLSARNLHGLGMMTIKERAEKLGAKLQFISKPQIGFQLLVNFY